jgi:hypothetical protein
MHASEKLGLFQKLCIATATATIPRMEILEVTKQGQSCMEQVKLIHSSHFHPMDIHFSCQEHARAFTITVLYGVAWQQAHVSHCQPSPCHGHVSEFFKKVFLSSSSIGASR